MSPILRGALPAAVLLVAVIFLEAQAPASPSPGTAPVLQPSLAMVRGETTADADTGENWLTTAIARPLFREGRRPAELAWIAEPKADEPMRLTGVITGPFGNRAIFRSALQAKPVVVSVGARVGDAVIRTIEPGRVIVESDGNIRTLQPSFAEGCRCDDMPW